MILDQEHQEEKYKEMYQDLVHAIMTNWRSEHDIHKVRRFSGLDTMIALEAPVRLELPELKWLESQMWRLRRIFLDQTDVLGQEETATVLVTAETILAKVLLAFARKYLNREDESKLSFLTADEGVFGLGG